MSTAVFPLAGQAIVPAGLAVPWASKHPGTISRLAHGAYHLPGHPIEAWMADLAAACAQVPGAVICLGSAAYFDLLIDDPPAVTCLFSPSRVRVDATVSARCRIIEIDRDLQPSDGIIVNSVTGSPIRRTTAVRTLVDLVRHASDPDQEAVLQEACRRLGDMAGGFDTLLNLADRLSICQDVRSRIARLAGQSERIRL